MATAAEDSAWLERVRTLPRKKITLNEDEIWALYQLIVAERSSNTPTLLPDLPSELRQRYAHRVVKLSDAHQDLTTPKET